MATCIDPSEIESWEYVDGINEVYDLEVAGNQNYHIHAGGKDILVHNSGKTYLAIRYIRVRAIQYPGSIHLVARYSFANAKKTIWLQTMLPEFRRDQKMGLCRIKEQEGVIAYENGSIVILGGLEPSRIDSILAAQYGTIFITEANENKYSDIENLFSRLNDTSTNALTGEPIPLKFIIDLNPTTVNNWTYRLFILGQDPITGDQKSGYNEFGYIHFKPEDNKANLADGYIETLQNLSPAKRERFYVGEFGRYEGLVYSNFVESEHVVDPFDIPHEWQRARAIDFGYVHPFVCLWTAMDPANEIIYIYREHVQTQQTVREHSESIKLASIQDLPDKGSGDREAWKRAERLYRFTAADHDAEDVATLQENGINSEKAHKEVLAGIDRTIDLMSRGKIRVFRSCQNVINGLLSYRWREQTTANRPKDREVVKDADDEMDAMRYAVMGWFPPDGASAGAHMATIGEGSGKTGRDIRAARLRRLGIRR